MHAPKRSTPNILIIYMSDRFSSFGSDVRSFRFDPYNGKVASPLSS